MPFAMRLWWDGRRGAAVRGHVVVPLTAPPDLGRGPVIEADFVPGVIASVRHAVTLGSEDMDASERAAARDIIDRLIPAQAP